MSSLRLRGGGERGWGRTGSRFWGDAYRCTGLGTLSPSQLGVHNHPEHLSEKSAGSPRRPDVDHPHLWLMAQGDSFMGRAYLAGVGSMTEKGNPETANHKLVTGRPGVHAEDA